MDSRLERLKEAAIKASAILGSVEKLTDGFQDADAVTLLDAKKITETLTTVGKTIVEIQAGPKRRTRTMTAKPVEAPIKEPVKPEPVTAAAPAKAGPTKELAPTKKVSHKKKSTAKAQVATKAEPAKEESTEEQPVLPVSNGELSDEQNSLFD